MSKTKLTSEELQDLDNQTKQFLEKLPNAEYHKLPDYGYSINLMTLSENQRCELVEIYSSHIKILKKSKLTLEQKAYVKSLDSKKKRKNQERFFKLQNKAEIVLESFLKITPTEVEFVVLNFELDQSQPIEKKSVEPSKEERIKEAVLMLNSTDLTIEQCKFYKTDMCKVSAFALAAEFRDKEKELTTKHSVVQKPELTKEMLSEVTEPKDDISLRNVKFKIQEYDGDIAYLKKPEPKVKTYTHEDMFSCFSESRLTNPIVGFKHDSFVAYLKSLE